MLRSGRRTPRRACRTALLAARAGSCSRAMPMPTRMTGILPPLLLRSAAPPAAAREGNAAPGGQLSAVRAPAGLLSSDLLDDGEDRTGVAHPPPARRGTLTSLRASR